MWLDQWTNLGPLDLLLRKITHVFILSHLQVGILLPVAEITLMDTHLTINKSVNKLIYSFPNHSSSRVPHLSKDSFFARNSTVVSAFFSLTSLVQTVTNHLDSASKASSVICPCQDDGDHLLPVFPDSNVLSFLPFSAAHWPSLSLPWSRQATHTSTALHLLLPPLECSSPSLFTEFLFSLRDHVTCYFICGNPIRASWTCIFCSSHSSGLSNHSDLIAHIAPLQERLQAGEVMDGVWVTFELPGPNNTRHQLLRNS